jgi:hypothetical protein
MRTELRSATLRNTAYWLSTGFAALVLGGTGAADLLRAAPIMEGLAHLGYPAYFATILGTWELLGAAAIVAPGLPRVKEWAYAGMFFTLTGAALSHAASGDPFAKVLFPLVVLGAVVVSWTLRPARRVFFVNKLAGPQALKFIHERAMHG